MNTNFSFSTTELTKPHNHRHYHFAQKYVELNYNATKAYLAVYGEEYRASNSKPMTLECAKASASRLLSDVTVRNYVEKLTKNALDAADVTVNSVISKFKTWSEFDPRDVFEWRRIELLDKHGNPYSPARHKMAFTAKNMEDIPENAWTCIESISEGRDGFAIKIVDKFKANEALAKYLGLDRKMVQNSGSINLHFDKDDENL